MESKIHRTDFSYFAAIMTPYAPMERFKTVCDWGSWAFPYDDSKCPAKLSTKQTTCIADYPTGCRLVSRGRLSLMLTR